MRYGFVIGTCGSKSDVDLNISNIRHFFGDVPILINDDASGVDWKSLVRKRDCDIHINKFRHHHVIGDLTAFYYGLKWAHNNNIQILIKVSRLLLFRNYISKYLDKVIDDKFVCASSNYYNFGYMTSLFAMHTDRFIHKYHDNIKQVIDQKSYPIEYETYRRKAIESGSYKNRSQRTNQELYFKHCLKIKPVLINWWQHRLFVWGARRHLSLRTDKFVSMPHTFENLIMEGKFMVHHKSAEIREALGRKYGLPHTDYFGMT